MYNSKTPRFIFQSHVLSVYCSLKCYFIFKDVELHRKYEAIQLEFTGAGMLLKHFIVQYMEGEGSLSGSLLCTKQKCARTFTAQGGGKVLIYTTIFHSLSTHTTCSHPHTLEIHPCGWTEPLPDPQCLA